MSTSDSRLGYIDCFDLMDKAIADPKGVRLKFGKYGDAWYFRLRIHSARRIDRTDNKRTYDEEHPLHGRSVYDDLIIRQPQRIANSNEVYLTIVKSSSMIYAMESLAEIEETEEEPAMADVEQEEAPAPILANYGVVGIKRRL